MVEPFIIPLSKWYIISYVVALKNMQQILQNQIKRRR
jgi:hypothetical protein